MIFSRRIRRPSPGKPLLALGVLVVAAGVLNGGVDLGGGGPRAGAAEPVVDTDQIVRIDSTVRAGWHYDYYENRAYPCSIDGYQTFAVGRRTGSSDTAERPLWVKMRGGGKGYFDETGAPVPSADNKVQISLDALLHYDTPGLMAQVKAAPEGFRTLLVSMCSHDVYAGNNNHDPNNPYTTPDGESRLTTGLISTVAAVKHTRAAYPTSAHFLHGTSAGGAGTFHVAMALQRQGNPPAGLVSDAGIVDQDRADAIPEHCVEDGEGESRTALAARVDPRVADPANQPDLLVSRGELTVPIMHVWNHGDLNACGLTRMRCTVRDGSTVTLTVPDCRHENMRRAIEALAPGHPSRNMPVCVAGAPGTPPCSQHVVTTRAGAVNTDPSSPADYQSAILGWVQALLARPAS